MRKKMIFRAMIALILVVAMLGGSALAASRSAKVFAPSMAVYRSVGSGRVGTLRRGTSITVKGVRSGWAKISYKGKTGYARLKNIEFNNRTKAVTTEASSIRFLTKNSYRKHTYYTGTLAAGITVYLAGMNGDNYLFYSEDGSAVGYVSKSAVRRAS